MLLLDHFFILAKPGAPEAGLLIDAGLVEGEANDHQGQGTSNRRFFFADTMLELLYVRDAAEAESGPAKRFCFPTRVAAEGGCPFGLVFRSSVDATSTMPFPGWRYEPEYLPPSLYMHVGDNSTQLDEPLCVFIPFEFERHPGYRHANPQHLGRLRVTLTGPIFSDVIQCIRESKAIKIRDGDTFLLEAGCAANAGHERYDLRPQLPLVLTL